MHDPERTVEFEFVRATENAALNAMRFIGKGDKNAADVDRSFVNFCEEHQLSHLFPPNPELVYPPHGSIRFYPHRRCLPK